jgi:hypothetical protein
MQDVTPAKAGVQFKDAWIPAFAGMTSPVLNPVLRDISETHDF